MNRRLWVFSQPLVPSHPDEVRSIFHRATDSDADAPTGQWGWLPPGSTSPPTISDILVALSQGPTSPDGRATTTFLVPSTSSHIRFPGRSPTSCLYPA